jgi:hypothetical protein
VCVVGVGWLCSGGVLALCVGAVARCCGCGSMWLFVVSRWYWSLWSRSCSVVGVSVVVVGVSCGIVLCVVGVVE